VPHRFPHAEITWKCSQRVVWIATHATEYVGVVEEHNGMYIANDSMRGTYNTYRTLGDAMQAFESPVGDSFARNGSDTLTACSCPATRPT
jgi:hypothetical protein